MTTQKGLVGWHTTNAAHYGLDRWKSGLFSSLKKPTEHVCLPRRPYFPPEGVNPHPTIPSAFTCPGEGLEVDAFFMDGASVACALSLAAKEGEKVLDMCSAPGGKAITIARTMKRGLLVCNELSKPRLTRLKQSVADFGCLTDQLEVVFTNQDATQSTKDLLRMGPYDKVLLDAPCSTDRHLITHQESMSRWSPQSVKQNAERQLQLLQAAAALVKPNGLIVYSTCALSEIENDGVIQKFMKKSSNFQVQKGKWIEDMKEQVPGAEETNFGCIMLPDKSNFGPLYVAHLRRDELRVLA